MTERLDLLNWKSCYYASRDACEELAKRSGAKVEWDEEGYPSLTMPQIAKSVRETFRSNFCDGDEGGTLTVEVRRLLDEIETSVRDALEED